MAAWLGWSAEQEALRGRWRMQMVGSEAQFPEAAHHEHTKQAKQRGEQSEIAGMIRQFIGEPENLLHGVLPLG